MSEHSDRSSDAVARARAALDDDERSRLTPVTDFVVRVGLAVVLGWVATIVGAVVLVVGWVQVSGTRDLPDELSYLSSATAGGLFLLGVAGLLVLSHHYVQSRRSVDALRHAIETVLDAIESRPATASPAAGSLPATFVRLPATRTYHRPDCVFVSGRADLVDALPDTGDGLRPCQVCAPDEE